MEVLRPINSAQRPSLIRAESLIQLLRPLLQLLLARRLTQIVGDDWSRRGFVITGGREILRSASSPVLHILGLLGDLVWET